MTGTTRPTGTARRRRARWAGPAPAGIALLIAGMAALWPSTARADDPARGRQLYQLCAACHGNTGEGNQQQGAPAIAGLPRWYVASQLTKFRTGVRAYHAQDADGLRMRPMARALMTDQDVKAVTDYVASLKPTRPAATLAGDPGRGQAAYVVCVACHGERAAGNETLNAPALARQSDWYLAAQLRKFRQGLRGTHPGDTTGAQMRPMAMTLGSDQAIDDVVAYIRSLGQ